MITEGIEALGLTHPITYAVVFVFGSMLMVWRLEAMMDRGLEGTAAGTLVMPYCSGLGNLIFVYLVLQKHGNPQEVVTNCLVNNVTNLTVLLGLPAILWGLDLKPPAKSNGGARRKSAKGGDQQRRLSQLSLLLTMAAVLFFSGTTWALGQRGKLEFSDGLALVGLFLFWQCFQVFDVLKNNVRQQRSFGFMFVVDWLLLVIGATLIYESLDWLVSWISAQKGGFVNAEHLGWLSGWLMVLPNAILAFYYAARRRADIVYTSQIGDGHICIPLCLGLFALFRPLPVPAFFGQAMIVLLAATGLHFVAILTVSRLPRWAGWALLGGYAWFSYTGLAGS